jgi:CRP-like cAMP-binding protein
MSLDNSAPTEPFVPEPAPGTDDDAARVEALLCAACRPAELSATAAGALARLAQVHRVKPGTPVLSHEQPAQSVWLVGSGRVALGWRASGASLQQRSTVEGGRWLDLASGLLRRHHVEDAVAETAAVLWSLPVEPMLALAPAHAGLMQALAAALAADVHALIGATRSLVMKDVLARCASWLLEHAQIAPGAEGRLTAVLQLQERKRAIAQQLGTTAETFSRTLRELSRMGLIGVRGYAITVFDMERLRAVAEPAPRRSAAVASG